MENFIDDIQAYQRLVQFCRACGHHKHCGYPCHEDGGGCACEVCECESCLAPNLHIGPKDI